MMWVILGAVILLVIVAIFILKKSKPKPKPKKTITLPNDLKLIAKPVDEIRKEIEEGIKKGAAEFGMDVNEFKHELLPELLSQIDNAKDKLLEYAEKGDYEAIDKLSHSVKGAALNMRVDILGLPLQEINRATRRREPMEHIKAYIKYFYKKYEAAKEGMKF